MLKTNLKLNKKSYLNSHSLDLFVLHVEEYPGEVTGPHLLAEVAPEFSRGSHIDVAGVIGNLVK